MFGRKLAKAKRAADAEEGKNFIMGLRQQKAENLKELYSYYKADRETICNDICLENSTLAIEMGLDPEFQNFKAQFQREDEKLDNFEFLRDELLDFKNDAENGRFTEEGIVRMADACSEVLEEFKKLYPYETDKDMREIADEIFKFECSKELFTETIELAFILMTVISNMVEEGVI